MIDVEEKTVGLFDILFDPRTGNWVWFFDDHKQFREVSESEMFHLKAMFAASKLNPFGVGYLLKPAGFDVVCCKGE